MRSVGGERGSYHVNDWHEVDDVAADVSGSREGRRLQWAREARERLRQVSGMARVGLWKYRHVYACGYA